MQQRKRHMLWISAGNLKEDKSREYKDWVRKNKDQIQKHAPPGWKHKGVFGTVLGFGRYDVLEMWEIKDYGDFDTLRNHDDPVFDGIYDEASKFFIPGAGEAWLVRDIADVVLPAPPKKRRK